MKFEIPSYLLLTTATFTTLSITAPLPPLAALESSIRASDPYHAIGLLCGQCALAGNDNSGCSGKSELTAVKTSNCTTYETGDAALLEVTQCFCSEDIRENREEYIRFLTRDPELCGDGEGSAAVVEAAVWAYGEYCATYHTSTSTGGVTTSSDSTTSMIPTPTPTPDSGEKKLGPLEIAGIVVGSFVGVAVAIGFGFWGVREARKRRQEAAAGRGGGGGTANGNALTGLFHAGGDINIGSSRR